MSGKKCNPRDAGFIRKFVVVLLRDTFGRLYSDSSIAAGLNSVIGTSKVWDPIARVLIQRAFKQRLVRSDEHYTLKCSKLLGYTWWCTLPSNNLHVLFHGNNDREVAIGRFKSEEAGNRAAGNVHEWCVMPAEEREELIQHLTARKQETSRKSGDKKAAASKKR